MTCPGCSRDVSAEFAFCPHCASPLEPAATERREERKLVTVLFCDLVGFTARAESMDPEDVQALLRTYHAHLRAELERFGGTVEKFIGDAVVAAFGAPVAHEDDPERAVRAALAIRDWAREQDGLELRVAVHTGEAVVTLDARPEQGEGMVAGDVVNTASRLQAAAPANGVLVGEATYRATERAVEYRRAAAVDAKGKAAPVPTWEAVEARSRLGVDLARRGRTPLVGRDRELDVLLDALARARERQPHLVSLVGVPGIGKSRLVAELFEHVEADDELITWRQGRSLPYGEGVSFWALGEMVKAHAGVLETDDPAAAERKLEAAVAALVEEDVEWVVRHLRRLVGLGGDGNAGGDRRGETFAAWRRFLEAVAEQGPLVLVFEDLHWADEGLLDFVDELVDRAGGLPLLVVATARPELLARRPGWGGGKRNASTISLSPLSDGETARLLAALLERPLLEAGTQAALLQRAGGNPLYAEEFARMLGEGEAAVDVPETLHGIVAARLDALEAAEKSLVQAAAVVGKVFWAGALAALVRRDRWEVEEVLHGLERREFVRRERRSSVAGDAEYAFLHVLVRDVAYGQLPRAGRADLHRRVAEWLESLGRPEDTAEMLAHHWASALDYARAAGRGVDDMAGQAARAFREAGDRASALSAAASALRFYERALELWPRDDAERPRLLLSLATVIVNVEGDPARVEDIRAELTVAGEPALAAEAASLLSRLEWHRGNRERSFALMREAAASFDAAPPSRAKAAVLAELGRLLVLAGSGDEGLALLREALATAEGLGLVEVQASALNTLGIHRVTAAGDLSGLDDLERAIELARDAGSVSELGRAHVNLAAISFFVGDLRREEAAIRGGIEIAERYGDVAGLRWLRGNKVDADYTQGRWDEALADCEALLGEIAAGLRHYQEYGLLCSRAMIRIARGDREGALADQAAALALARALEDPQALHAALCYGAAIRAHAGDLTAAGAYATEMLSLAARDPADTAMSWIELAIALVALGRADEFVDLAARDSRRSRWLDAARAFALGDALGAAELLADMGAVTHEAYARLAAARDLVAAGRRSEADAELARALAFYRSVGATTFVRQGETLLAMTG